MCLVTYYQHKNCKHIWATVTEPCGPWMGFSNCNSFGGGEIKGTPRFYKTRSRPCPRCELGGAYDRHAVRMVEKMGWGFHWGMDPDGGDWAVEVRLGEARGCVVL